MRHCATIIARKRVVAYGYGVGRSCVNLANAGQDPDRLVASTLRDSKYVRKKAYYQDLEGFLARGVYKEFCQISSEPLMLILLRTWSFNR